MAIIGSQFAAPHGVDHGINHGEDIYAEYRHWRVLGLVMGNSKALHYPCAKARSVATNVVFLYVMFHPEKWMNLHKRCGQRWCQHRLIEQLTLFTESLFVMLIYCYAVMQSSKHIRKLVQIESWLVHTNHGNTVQQGSIWYSCLVQVQAYVHNNCSVFPTGVWINGPLKTDNPFYLRFDNLR